MTGFERPLARDDRRGRMAPFAVAVAVELAVLVLPPATANPTFLVAGVALLVLILAATVAVPWERLPGWTDAAPAVAFLIPFMLLRHSAGGASSGLAPLVVLPALWIGLHGTRRQLDVVVALIALALVAPIVLVGAPTYPSAEWRRVVLSVVVCHLVGRSVLRLVGEVRERAAQLERLATATRTVNRAADPRQATCAALRSVCGADLGLLLEVRDERLVSTGVDGPDPGRLSVLLAEAPVAISAALHSGRRTTVPDAASEAAFFANLAVSTGIVSAVLQPVCRDGSPGGLLLLLGYRSAARELSSYESAALDVLAGEASTGIERVDLMQRLARSAEIDIVTGVSNRRAWDRQLGVEISRAARTGLPLTVMIVAVDGFRSFAETYDRHAADKLLADYASTLRSLLRDVDVIGRSGAEQFILALPDCDRAGSERIANRIRAAVVPGGAGAPELTCSLGWAAWDGVESPEQLLVRADYQLYLARSSGTDRRAPSAAPTNQAIKSGQVLPVTR